MYKSQERKPDPEVSIKGDKLYSRAWECDYEKPKKEYDEAAPPNLPKNATTSDLPPEEMWNTPRSTGDHYPEVSLSTDRLCDGTDKYHYIEHDAYMSWEQHNSVLTNPRSSK